MDRRTFLAGTTGTVGGVCGLAGCAGLVGDGGSGVTSREFPDRPDEFTPETVTEYVAEYEEVRTHNAHVESGAVDVSVTAVATFDHAAVDDHYATAQHAGTVSHEDGSGGRSVGELAGDPTPYLVTPARTLRMDVSRRRVDAEDRAYLDDATTDQPLGVRTCNVTDDPRELSITVVRREVAPDNESDLSAESGGRETDAVVETPVTVEPESALELRGITDVRGSYRVTARMAENGVTSEGRIEAGLPSTDRGPNVDVVVDDDGISTRHLPSFEPI